MTCPDGGSDLGISGLADEPDGERPHAVRGWLEQPSWQAGSSIRGLSCVRRDGRRANLIRNFGRGIYMG